MLDGNICARYGNICAPPTHGAYMTWSDLTRSGSSLARTGHKVPDRREDYLLRPSLQYDIFVCQSNPVALGESAAFSIDVSVLNA
jgi:hypothetical protein